MNTGVEAHHALFCSLRNQTATPDVLGLGDGAARARYELLDPADGSRKHAHTRKHHEQNPTWEEAACI
jgi:hypothetical protein